jgi:murein tripeptide amidase MpaA
MLQLVEFRDLHPELIDSVDWYIMPVANPDGYEYSHSTDRLWRKTRSGGKVRQRWGKRTCYGVDPNRNWDFHWGEDPTSSSDACTDDFRGPRAFSEPETKAMADFILTRKDQIKIYLTLHSYSQMWLVPWGYKNEKPKDYYDMYILAEKGVEALEAVRGIDYLLGTAAELLYTASGMVKHSFNLLFACLQLQATQGLQHFIIYDSY